ncbi:MAG: ATP-binding cassette domain-containing protein [Akkermansia sp.]|nr:ATP-binding cassette domain-containing protein [Akkermansia sp.]
MNKRLLYLLLATRRRFVALRGRLAKAFSRVPRRLAARNESRRGHAGVVVDLFASIMARVDGIGIEDLDTTMDMLRSDFPNVEHSWLAARFQAAYTARYSLDDTLKLASAQRTEEERIALALEILTMLYRVGGDLTNPTLFDRITNGLNLPGYASMLEELIITPGKDAPAPIQSLSFTHAHSDNSVTLAKEEGNVSFRALHCVHVLLIINDSRKPFTICGRILHQGDMQLLSPGQSVELSEWCLGYNTIRSLIQNRYSGVSYVGYLYREYDEMSISRQRPRNALARVRFSLHVQLEILNRDADFKIDGKTLQPGDVIKTTYYTPFTIMGLGPYRFAELHNVEAPGRSYQLAPDTRKLLVTNLPYINSTSALMLTPGLAPAVVFEVSYSRTETTGTLRIIEGNAGITVNGIPVKGDTPLNDGDLISLSHVQSLRCRFSTGVLDEESSLIHTLKVQGLTRDFVRTGRVVDNIDFTLKRGEMACILGPSGSGKSTLLSMLAGHLSPSFGTVQYNKELLTPHATKLRRYIAYIPREDILDEAMTVGEHIYHASIARHPRLNDADRKRRVLSILNYVGLGALANRNVGRAGERTISDGERTRLNLGLDLSGTAEVFLIDEPISGLSSGDAERVIDTLENMAASRILLCTLHRPSQVILNRFKKVMVLNSNGQMAFWGSPTEMVNYFRKSAQEMGLHVSREAVAAGGADYVFEVLEAPYTRLGNEQRPSPTMWQNLFEGYCYRRNSVNPPPEQEQESESRTIPPLPRRNPLVLWRLFYLWMNRTFLARVRSRMGLYAVLLEGPVLALLIAGTLRAASDVEYTFYKSLHINEYLFLSLVLAMFFGLTDSACEILRDRPLIRRESNYKLFIPGYLLAKVLVLTGIAAVQCALYLWVGNAILGIEQMFWQHMGVMVLTAFVGISLSLMVSALVRSERTALNIVPLLLVPQILLAGALVRFEEMNEFSPKMPTFLPEKIDRSLSNLRHRVAYQDEETHNITSKPVPFIAEFCPLRYAFEMMFVTQTHGNLWEVETGLVNARREHLKEHGSLDEVRFIQRAALLLNSPAANADEARSILRRVRKAALYHDEKYLERLSIELEEREPQAGDQPIEFFFSNRKLQVVKEGVKTARKDGRKNELRGFFLAPRQARSFSGINQETDAHSVSTIIRNAVYLLIMGLCPIVVAAMRLRSICRGG